MQLYNWLFSHSDLIISANNDKMQMKAKWEYAGVAKCSKSAVDEFLRIVLPLNPALREYTGSKIELVFAGVAKWYTRKT